MIEGALSSWMVVVRTLHKSNGLKRTKISVRIFESVLYVLKSCSLFVCSLHLVSPRLAVCHYPDRISENTAKEQTKQTDENCTFLETEPEPQLPPIVTQSRQKKKTKKVSSWFLMPSQIATQSREEVSSWTSKSCQPHR